ncbi:hypothetical protein DSL72_004553 [Monilinia vaccinii-corymbosi]|uniref:Major facilitator superfamily (MFS) profile domain-containing protein n=1 Tax=Monilinia vaccinii-corymbosi TaxID=61207 RepID=A0A8A3NWG0_9HELO|nr:hypothetical protein DSL72_004553 [Monilinia vaccinii-corymbosi]
MNIALKPVAMPASGDPQESNLAENSKEQLPDVESALPPSGDEAVDPNARPAVFRWLAQEILFILTATMTIAMPSFLQGSILIAAPAIQKALSMTTVEVTWMMASSSLTSGSFMLFFGKIADMFGRRSIMLIGLFLTSFLSLAAGFSKNALTLNILNGVIGLVAAFMIPSAQGILGSVYEQPSKRKNYAFACYSSGNHLGFTFSAILSGIVTQAFGWSASFWLIAIIYLVVAVVSCFTVPIDTSDKLPLGMKSLKEFDFVGALLTIVGIGLFSAGISTGPSAPDGWKTPYILVFIILGPLLLATFVWWEYRFEYPLLPMNVWRDREFNLLLIILLLAFLSFPALYFFTSLFLQHLFGYSALRTAVCLLPSAFTGLLVNTLAGNLLHRVSNKLLMAIGATGFTLAFLLVALQRSGDSYWALTFPALILVVVGTDFEFNVVNMYVVSSLPKSQQSIASSIFQTTIKLATVIGTGVCTAIFDSVSLKISTGGYYANDPYEPYAFIFWFSFILSFISLLVIPFLKIKTQGNAV